jgi:hypothetical protein
VSRADLGTFWAEAWSQEPDGIPVVQEPWVPEPAEGLNISGQFVKHNRFSIGSVVGHS